MTQNLTRILDEISAGRPAAMDELLALVYEELHGMAAAKLAVERSAHVLQPTALVHEAYIRMVEPNAAPKWENRKCFFHAAAEAMRRILVENARSQNRAKRGGGRRDVELFDVHSTKETQPEDILDIHEALEHLAQEDPEACDLVKLHYFGGLSMAEIAEVQGIHVRMAQRIWVFARAWLCERLGAFGSQDSAKDSRSI